MSVNVVINGVTYAQPNQGTPPPWGDIQADIIVALVSSVLQKSGGTFTLTAEAYFGATYGLKSQYYKGPTANPASAGVLRLAVSEGMGWRNNANNGDLLLTVNGSNALLFNGVQLAVGTGDVAGPGSSTDNAVARFDSTTGKVIQNSGVIIDDSNNISGVGTLTAGGVLFSDKVTGPASSVDNTLPRFDSTTGKLIQTSGVVVSDADAITGVSALTTVDLTVTGALSIPFVSETSSLINASYSSTSEGDVTDATVTFTFGTKDVLASLEFSATDVTQAVFAARDSSANTNSYFRMFLNIDGTNVSERLFYVAPGANQFVNVPLPSFFIPAGTIAAGSKVVKIRCRCDGGAGTVTVTYGKLFLRVTEQF